VPFPFSCLPGEIFILNAATFACLIFSVPKAL
jgi:hypothetical protein